MADTITDSAEFMVAPLIRDVLVMINKACSVEDDMVMNMILSTWVLITYSYFLSGLRLQIVALSDGQFRHQLLQV